MWFSHLAGLNKWNTISCSDTTLWGDTMFYQEKDFIGYSHIQHLVPKFTPFNRAIASVIITACKISTAKQYDYGNKFNRDAMNRTTIQLPTKNWKIDFDFMEAFIAELDAQRLAELEAYLKITWLRDFNLTTEERAVLETFRNGGGVKWTLFNLKRLFWESTRGKRLKSDDRITGDLPFVTAWETDEGISAFIGNTVDIFSENTTTIDMFGSAKYRNYSYGWDDHIAVVHTESLPKFASIFVTTAIHKTSHAGQFSYSRNFYAKDADELDILLPILNSQPDYLLMETLISAIQKLVIRDVVEYADRRIEATRQVIRA